MSGAAGGGLDFTCMTSSQSDGVVGGALCETQVCEKPRERHRSVALFN